MKIKNVFRLNNIIILFFIFILSPCTSSYLNELNPIKDGITSTLNINGPIKGFSFEEKQEINRIADIENYFPKIRRKTEDGRFCSKVFVSEHKTFFDCTTSKTPDGDLTAREWCYVDVNYTEKSTWGYCTPILDFDKVRAVNYQLLREATKLISNLNLDVSQNIPAAQKSLEDIKEVKQIQTKVEEKIKILNLKTKGILNKLDNLEQVKNQLNEQDKNLNLLFFQIEEKIRLKKMKNFQTDEDTKSANCKGMLLYEDNNEGEGLRASFYDNENWLGSSVKTRSNEINFDWTNTQPIKGINPNNFSVIWDGWLLSPINEYYTFSIYTNGGAELYFNNELIIKHNMKSVIESYKILLKSENTPDKKPNTKLNPFKAESKSIHLISNIKYKLILRFFHSVHTTTSTNDQVFLKLLWKSNDFEEEVIPLKYLFPMNEFNPLKITEFNNEDSNLRRLHENDPAFKNSDRYYLQDIPTQFLNLNVLRFDTLYIKDFLRFTCNSPTDIYIGLLDHYPNPLGPGFENTSFGMSLLEIDKNSSKGNTKFVAKKSAKITLYKRSFMKGEINIEFNKFGLNSKGIPMILIVSFTSDTINLNRCTGKEFLISESTSRFFKNCIASSALAAYQCEDGFSNKMRDEEGAIWAAKADGIGAWISVKFHGLHKITSIEYLNRKNPSERNKQIEISFSSGYKKILNLKNDDKLVKIRMDSVRSNFVKFTIKDVYGTLNNGGAFNIYGLECKATNSQNLHIDSDKITSGITDLQNKNTLPPLFTSDITKPIYLNCNESLTNSNKFNSFKLGVNDKILVKCSESCATSEIEIYGDEIYSRDSGICKAAFHNKKISSLGGLVKMIIKPEMSFYKGTLSNGIKSLGRSSAFKSIALELYEEEDIIVLKPGSKVDLRIEDKINGKIWEPAIITKLFDTNSGKFISLILDGEKSETFESRYPDKDKIHPCGVHIKNRDCKGSLKTIINKKPILIRFVSSDYQINLNPDDVGYLADNGEVFGQFNKPYGWSSNMSSKIVRRLNPKEPILETFIKFPPYANSSSCNRPQPEELCEPASWKVKAGKGKFQIKIYLGDTNKDRIVNLKINGKYLAKNKFIPKNSLEVISDTMETKNQMFELTSECTENCDNSKTILNAIELIPDDFSSEDSQASRIEKETNCGNSLVGGQCQKGPIVLHCLFDDPSVPSAKYCNGELALVSIPRDYKCRDQFGQYKCVNKIYSDESQCKMHCPKKCKESKCIY